MHLYLSVLGGASGPHSSHRGYMSFHPGYVMSHSASTCSQGHIHSSPQAAAFFHSNSLQKGTGCESTFVTQYASNAVLSAVQWTLLPPHPPFGVPLFSGDQCSNLTCYIQVCWSFILGGTCVSISLDSIRNRWILW